MEEVATKGEGEVVKVSIDREGEGKVMKIGMEGEGGVEGFIDNIGGGEERRKNGGGKKESLVRIVCR